MTDACAENAVPRTARREAVKMFEINNKTIGEIALIMLLKSLYM